MLHTDAEHRRNQNLARLVEGHAEDFIGLLHASPMKVEKAARVTDCVRLGYTPLGYRVADLTVVQTQGRFHLFHIPRVGENGCLDPANEHWFGHAVSDDLDTWITQNPPLYAEPNNYFESAHIWAPFVLEHEKTWYMFYTGLTAEPSQVLCMASSTDPDLNVWQRFEGNPIIPLEGLPWHWPNPQGHVRQARDPHVVWTGNHFLMAYTTMHANGCPAVGGLISTDLKQWEDIGPIFYRPMKPGEWMPESVNIQQLPDGQWVLIPSISPGLEYYLSDDPHHWHDAQAHQIKIIGSRNSDAIGPEILCRDDEKGKWLVGYFENTDNRFYLGVLNIREWELERLRDPAQLEPWRSLIGKNS